MPLVPDAPFDRRAELRGEPGAQAELRRDPAGLYLPVWRNRNLVARTDPPGVVALDHAEARPWLRRAESLVFLGVIGGRPCFAFGLPGEDDVAELAAGRGDFNDLRLVGPTLPADRARVLAYARAMACWHRQQRCCGRCGTVLRSEDGGHVRVCPHCEARHFPRTDPAMMALVRRGERILLARQPRFPPKMVSVLAGFVEPGERLEEAVVREVREEVGLEVENVRYLRSQPWPFPASLMIGFSMDSPAGAIRIDEQELEAAAWYERDQIRAAESIFVPPSFSLAGQLIEMFLDGSL